jgi:thymidylate kinase
MVELNRVRKLFAQLDNAGVAYCHWKSNEHLAAALAGETDLDLLVDPERRDVCERVLVEQGFQRFVAPAWGRYEGIEDYIGLDPETGRLLHLHWHWELSVGRMGVKEYRLPWERYVLDTRRRDPEFGCSVADPAVEYVLLLVRAHLKGRRYRDRGDPVLGEDMGREAVWLRERIEAEHLRTVATDLLGAESARRIVATLEAPLTAEDLEQLARKAIPPLATLARQGPLRRFGGRWIRALACQTARVGDRGLRQPVARRRILPRGGIVLAVLGADGSGKSSTVADLAKWLSWKVDVYPMYMGVPKLFTRGLRRIVRVVPRAAPDDEKPSSSAGSSAAKRGTLRPVLRAIWASAIAIDKRLRLKRAARARRRGLVVLCDRYPQAATMNFNDGPLLSAWKEDRSPLTRRLARWEFETYAPRPTTTPDLVLKLNVSPEVSVARRPDEMTIEAARRKTTSIRELVFPPEVRVVEIDADRPLDAVLLQARQAVWEAIRA